MKVYITKYALSKGIQRHEVSDIKHGTDRVFILGAMYSLWFFKPHWHTDKNTALQQAELMRLKKIASLERQIFKLRGLKFK